MQHLAEIGIRALSPAMNDPGTAIRIIGSLVRLLSTWRPAATGDPDDGPEFDPRAIDTIRHGETWNGRIQIRKQTSIVLRAG